MFGVAGTARIWLWSGPCDLRYGIDRLSGLVEEHFGDEILSGAYFVFLSRGRDKVKVLWWIATAIAFGSSASPAAASRLPRITTARPASVRRNSSCSSMA